LYLTIGFLLFFVLILAILLILYISRGKKSLPLKYKNDDNFNLFLKDLKLYLEHHHPKIDFNYHVIGNTIHEKKEEMRELLVIENIVEQFYNHKYQKVSQSDIPREKYWPNYIEKSNSEKLPNDWPLRKESVWRRDNKCCNRCGKVMTLDETYTCFVKDIRSGGGYNFENIIILCVDCNKIVNLKSTYSSLTLNDKLMALIKT